MSFNSQSAEELLVEARRLAKCSRLSSSHFVDLWSRRVCLFLRQENSLLSDEFSSLTFGYQESGPEWRLERQFKSDLHSAINILSSCQHTGEKVAEISNEVFVIHGRNMAARDAVFAFLRSLALVPIEWEQALGMASEPSPFIGNVLELAMTRAAALVVVLTGDEEVTLRPQFKSAHDDKNNAGPVCQARPNVLFEAGMALGMNRSKTVILEIGQHRMLSDLAGRHVLRCHADDADFRTKFSNRLQQVGCPVSKLGVDWLKAGNFEKAISLSKS